MIVKWKNVVNIYDYVNQTLAEEANDIPLEEINKGVWTLNTIDIDKIKVDLNMIKDHDKDPIHVQRRDVFINLIKEEKEILPLIVIGETLFLVDGYARYRALKKIGINQVRVFRQTL